MMSLRTILVKYLLPLHFLILSYSCSTIPLDIKTNPSIDFNIEGKFKLTYLEYKRVWLLCFKKENKFSRTYTREKLSPPRRNFSF